MRKENSSELIGESELRLALQPMRLDRDHFEAEIQQRVEAELRLRQKAKSEDTILENSGWLQAAAAVIPLPLLNKGISSSLTKYSIGQLSLGKKIVALAALPAIGITLMVTVSLWAFIKVRMIQQGQHGTEADTQQAGEIIKNWWRQFGIIAVSLPGISLLLIFTGYVVPVFVIFLMSGIFMVSLMKKLGNAQLVDRNAIGSAITPGLLIISQATFTLTMFNHGYPFLDQKLILAVLTSSALLIMIICRISELRFGRLAGLIYKWVFGFFLTFLVGWFSSSLWNPVSTNEIETFVESFEHAEFSTASWQEWKTSSNWLHDLETELELTKPHRLLVQELSLEKPNVMILSYALEAGLFQPEDLDQLDGLIEQNKSRIQTSSQVRPFHSVESHLSFLIRALVARDELDEDEKDYLSKRFIATMDEMREKKSLYNLIEEQLAITNLAQVIDRPLDLDLNRQFVHQTLVNYQCLDQPLIGQRAGGFSASSTHKMSTSRVTADAIDLMQIYGVPEGVNIAALRSYLRPTSNDQWSRMLHLSCVRAASLQRLESLPGVPPITWRDYFLFEQNLMMAILFSLFCIFTILGAPNLRCKQQDESNLKQKKGTLRLKNI